MDLPFPKPCQCTVCHAITRGYHEEYPIHGVNPGPKRYLSKCEEKTF